MKEKGLKRGWGMRMMGQHFCLLEVTLTPHHIGGHNSQWDYKEVLNLDLSKVLNIYKYKTKLNFLFCYFLSNYIMDTKNKVKE